LAEAGPATPLTKRDIPDPRLTYRKLPGPNQGVIGEETAPKAGVRPIIRDRFRDEVIGHINPDTLSPASENPRKSPSVTADKHALGLRAWRSVSLRACSEENRE